MSVERLYTELFELIGYMLSSARGLIDEPQLYGPLRLIDGVYPGVEEGEVAIRAAVVLRRRARDETGQDQEKGRLTHFD